MRSLRSALCLLAFSAVVQTAGADPIQAPGAPVPADPLIPLVDQAIAITRQRNLDFQVHTPWQILHGLLALRTHYTLKNGNEFVNALDYISSKATFKGERWFERTPAGAKAHPYNGTPYDFEGHVNQTMAILAMCDLPLTHQFTLKDGSKVTMAEMIRHAQWAVSDKEETTWTLWFLTHYVDQDAQWKNSAGEQWSMERLVRIQVASSHHNAPCGGCHSLFAIAYARNAYLQKHGKLQGAWLEADQKLQQYIAAAQSMMNRDGSFATQYFKARGFSYDFNERIASSGHMIEWLMVALPRKRLNEQWLRLGVQTLANDLIRNASQPADCGPLYHSLNALALFKQRMESNTTPEAQPELAVKPEMTPASPARSIVEGNTQSGSMRPRPEVTSNSGRTTEKPAVTAAADPLTVSPDMPAKETTPSPNEATPPVKVAEEPKPISSSTEANKTLKSAALVQTPSLVAPPVLVTPALKPTQIAEEPATLKKLSGETNDTSEKAQQADAVENRDATTSQKSSESRPLTPVAGGMPILKQHEAPAAGTQALPVKDGLKANTSEEDKGVKNNQDAENNTVKDAVKKKPA